MTTALLLVAFGALTRLLPHPPNAVALGALALYAGARLPRRWAFAAPLAALLLSDFFLDFGTGRAAVTLVRAVDYAAFAGIVLLGRAAASNAPPLGLAGLSVCGSLAFFLASNFAVWLSGELYPKSSAGLALCFTAALPFLWSTLAADLAGTTLFFGVDALSRRRAAWRVAAAALPLLLLPSAVAAQRPSPVSEQVVVTATAYPEEETELGSAATVITRERIRQQGFQTVAEVLRSVPGVEVARSGSDGAVTSVFLRGANSTHTLVLVDGARMNSPFFPGYDFSTMTVENIERIEVVRGPFSALYGSDAIGGVIQIFTRPAAGKLSGQASFEAGDVGQRAGAAFLSGSAGPLGFSASYRDGRLEGDRPNSDWRQQSGALRLEGRVGAARIALEGGIVDGEVGVPGPVGAETPLSRYFTREERLSIPAVVPLSGGHELALSAARVASRPESVSPEYAFESRTDALSWQAGISDTWTRGSNRLTAFASWQLWEVSDRSNYGVNLDGSRTKLWGAGAEDTYQFSPSLTATAGFRYDRHSVYGDAWSPRATLAWRSPDSLWKVRASGGGAFRAPTVGELYYPFSGNPDLEPERSTSWELGAERSLGAGRAQVSLFWNDLRDLIVYDFARFQNFNVQRARTRGVEVAVRQDVVAAVAFNAGYTYLDAEDRDSGEALLRRPRHSAFFDAVLRPWRPLAISPRVTFVGKRPDADALTGARVEQPSFVRLDLFARYELAHFAPYARLENLTDELYEEVNGYPAPGRRFALGLEARF
ncbi:MAG: TonB-dependent receptor domain-containing protein [Thermoanaerobaculia bacterium]